MKQKFCAHRGLSGLIPDNTLPSFAAAILLGADEIEFDIRGTRDKKLAVIHDIDLSQIGNTFNISDYTLSELMSINVGEKMGWNISICTAQDVFEQFAGKAIFNIHLKEEGGDGYIIKEAYELVKKYNMLDKAYFAGSPVQLEWMIRVTPDMPRVAIESPGAKMDVFDMVEKYSCRGVQFWPEKFPLDKARVDKMHDKNVFCNVFYGDTKEDFDKYFNMGVETILTNRMDIAVQYKKENT